MSRLGRMPVDTARYNASHVAEDLVKQSDKQSAEGTCARSSICPEHDPCATFESCVLFLSDQASGLWKQSWPNC